MPTGERFAAPVVVSSWPYCPACGRPLTPTGIIFIHGYAFCSPCWEGCRGSVRIAQEVLRLDIMHKYTSTTVGLFFFANLDESTRGVPAVKLFERLTGKSCVIDGRTNSPVIVDDIQVHRGQKAPSRPAPPSQPDAAPPANG